MPRPRLILAMLWWLTFPAAAEEPIALAVFDFELIDTSLEGEVNGPRADEQQRLVMIGELLRQKLTDSGRYALVDLAPQAERIAAAGYRHGCNGCIADFGRDAGAAQAMAGTIQKVSNLILNINLYVWDTATGAQLRGWSVDIRGNTDESWAHGIKYLVKNRVLKE